jgi:serine/threonine-protein kinase RsbW
MAELPNLRLDLANRPENVLLVRETLTGVAEAVELEGDDLHDIRTAVTEACNNVVLHAYGGGKGPLEVEVYAPARAIEVVVRDHGTGIRPRIRTAEQAPAGLGLPIIQALAHSVEFIGAIGEGTELRMRFTTPSSRALQSCEEDGLQSFAAEPAELDGTARLAITPIRLARTVLPRLLSALGARAHFSTDAICDAQLLADALVAPTPGAADENHLCVAVDVQPHDLQLRIGPLGVGRARRLIDDSTVAGLGPVIESLTDRQSVTSSASSEMLTLRLSDRR